MSDNVTRMELSKQIARNCESSIREGEEVLEVILESIVRALSSGERVEIRGFGSFATRARKARTGRNPKTGLGIDIPAKRVPYFRPSRQLIEVLSGRTEDDGE